MWKITMYHLMRKYLWDFFEESTPSEEEHEKEKDVEWRKKNNKTLWTIANHLHDDVLHHIFKIWDAKQAWGELD